MEDRGKRVEKCIDLVGVDWKIYQERDEYPGNRKINI
jgi:hypothetical protein